MSDTTGVTAQARRLEELIAKVEASRDPALVSTARELIETLMAVHGAALERMLEIVAQAGSAGREIAGAFGRDHLVGSLLVLYGLQPLDLETRVRQALQKLRAREVELVGVADGVVTLRVRNPGPGCASAVDEAIYADAPDVTRIVIEGLEKAASGFVPIESLMAGTR